MVIFLKVQLGNLKGGERWVNYAIEKLTTNMQPNNQQPTNSNNLKYNTLNSTHNFNHYI